MKRAVRRTRIGAALALAWLLGGGGALAQPAATEPAAAATEPAPAATEPAAAAPTVPTAPAAPGSGRYDRRLQLPSTPQYFDDASRLPMAPILVQPAPASPGSRPTVWLGGLLVLVAVFLWNRSRRAELERLEAAASRRQDDPEEVKEERR